MSLQLDSNKKIDIIKRDPYKSIVNILRCFPKGLEAKHLSYELVEEVINKKSKSSIAKRPLILEESRIKEYLKKEKKPDCYYRKYITPCCIKNRQRLNECLKILQKHRLIIKHDKKYLIRPRIKDRLSMDRDVEEIEEMYRVAFLMKTLISTKYVNIYEPILAREYLNSEEVKKQVDKIITKINNLMKELCDLTKKIHRKDDIESLEYFRKSLNTKEVWIYDKVYTDEEMLKTFKSGAEKTIENIENSIKNPPIDPRITIVVHSREKLKKLDKKRKMVNSLSRFSSLSFLASFL